MPQAATIATMSPLLSFPPLFDSSFPFASRDALSRGMKSWPQFWAMVVWLTWFEARSGGEMAEVGSGRGLDRVRATMESVRSRRWVVLNFMVLWWWC